MSKDHHDHKIGPHVSAAFWAQRLCSFNPRYWVGDDEDCCGKPAVLHLAWNIGDPDSIEGATACADHMATAMRWTPYEDLHTIGDHCCLPGAFWVLSQDGSEGHCYIDMDGGLESLLGTVTPESELVPA